jgi:hypothetical protein
MFCTSCLWRSEKARFDAFVEMVKTHKKLKRLTSHVSLHNSWQQCQDLFSLHKSGFEFLIIFLINAVKFTDTGAFVEAGPRATFSTRWLTLHRTVALN